MLSNLGLVQLFLALFVLTLGESRYTLARRKLLNIDNSRITCSLNMDCRLAVCLWERIPRITEEKCRFLDNNCSCPNGKICALTDHFTPRNKLITFHYRCRNPAELFPGHGFSSSQQSTSKK